MDKATCKECGYPLDFAREDMAILEPQEQLCEIHEFGTHLLGE